MPTHLETRPTSAQEAFVQRKLGETCRRIRQHDVLTTLLMLGCLVCGYGLAAGIFDLLTEGVDAAWPGAVRWSGFALFLVGVALIGTLLVRRVTRRINPYYAARSLEQTVPGSKNSLINWLDLHDETLHPAFRKNLSARAGDDLKEADPEQTVDRRTNWVLLALFTAGVIGLLILLAARPNQFFSLLQRAFAPFAQGQLATQTTISMVRPESGDAAVAENQPVHFVAQIEGRYPGVNQPGAPALQYRYQSGDAFVTLPLAQDANGLWYGRLLADQVRNTGVGYKITAGDAETPEYQITVRPQPHVKQFEVTYHPRPYLRLDDETVQFPNQHSSVPSIKAPRGTDVTLLLRTNRKVRLAGVEVTEGSRRRELPTHVLPDDPTAFRCRWTVERSGHFRVTFTSAEGEANADQRTYDITALEDGVPTVELTRPGEDVSLPANGTLLLEGLAQDDFGLKAVTLRMLLLDGERRAELQPKPYLGGKALDADDPGVFPDNVAYVDFAALDELRDAQDRRVELKADMAIEYWLEATDNSDYPNKDGNVGKSKSFKVRILPPELDPQKQQADRAKAQAAQKENAQKQPGKGAQGSKEGGKDKGGDGGAKQAGSGQDEAQKLRDELKQKMDDLGKGQPKPGEAKGEGQEQQPKSDSKPGEQGKGGPSADKKDEQKPSPEQAGTNKGQDQARNADQKPGEAKNDGKAHTEKDGQQAAKKDGDQQPGAKKDQPGEKGSQAKDQGPQPGKQKAGEGKGPESAKQQPKDNPQAKGQETAGAAPDAKSKDDTGKPGNGGQAKNDPGRKKQDDAPSQAKGEQGAGPKSEAKAADAKEKDQPQPNMKSETTKGMGPEQGMPRADAKQPPADKGDAAGTVKGDESAKFDPMKAKTPTPEDVANLKDLLNRKDSLGEMAAKALSKMSKEAPDPELREQAKEALDQAGRSTTGGTQAGEPKEPTSPTVGEKPAPTGPEGGAKAGTPSTAENKKPPSPEKGDGGVGQTPAGDTEKGNAGTNPGAGKGIADGPGADPASSFAERGGALQIEDFLRMAKERKQAGISDAEWQELLDKAARYNELVAKAKPTANTKAAKRGTPGQLGGLRPRELSGPSANPGSPLDAGQAQPPPELLDAQRRFGAGRRPMP